MIFFVVVVVKKLPVLAKYRARFSYKFQLFWTLYDAKDLITIIWWSHGRKKHSSADVLCGFVLLTVSDRSLAMFAQTFRCSTPFTNANCESLECSYQDVFQVTSHMLEAYHVSGMALIGQGMLVIWQCWRFVFNDFWLQMLITLKGFWWFKSVRKFCWLRRNLTHHSSLIVDPPSSSSAHGSVPIIYLNFLSWRSSPWSDCWECRIRVSAHPPASTSRSDAASASPRAHPIKVYSPRP